MSEMISIEEFEIRVLELEDIRLVVRAPTGTKVGAYNYERKASGTSSVSVWLETRVKPLIKGLGVAVINGEGLAPHGLTQLEKVRKSYNV